MEPALRRSTPALDSVAFSIQAILQKKRSNSDVEFDQLFPKIDFRTSDGIEFLGRKPQPQLLLRPELQELVRRQWVLLLRKRHRFQHMDRMALDSKEAELDHSRMAAQVDRST